MTTSDLSLARESMTALLAQHAGGAAWAQLDVDGWLDVLPEAGGEWTSVDLAAAALDVIGAEGHDVAYAPHLVAASALADAGADPDGERLAIALDLVPVGTGRRGRLWGDADATIALADAGDAGLVRVPRAAWRRVEPEDELLSPVGVVWTELRLDDGDPLAADESVVTRHRTRTAYALAAEAAGAVRRSTLRTIDYIKSRQAFGSSLASFQALQHRAVDMYAVSILADALVMEATDRWREGEDATHASWAAKAYLGDAGTWAVENAIQLHGGIGFTWEIGLHLALRRTQRARLLAGGVQGTAHSVLASRSILRAGHLAAVTDWSLRAEAEEGDRA